MVVSFYKVLFIILLAGISCLHADDNLKSIESNPDELLEFTQLEVASNKLNDTTYTYKCTVGSKKIGRVGCASQNRTVWPTPHNVVLSLRCPGSGTGSIITYVEVQFKVTSQNVNCVVTEGGVGRNFIVIKISTWGTKLLDYIRYFYMN